MIKVKNVRAGIVIIADAGLKLAPGETVPVERLTPQMQSAVDAGLLARTDSDSESKPKPKSQPKAAEAKSEAIGAGKLALDGLGAQATGGDEAKSAAGDAASAEITSGVKSAGK